MKPALVLPTLVMPPQDVLALTLANLDGEFARVVTADEVPAEVSAG